MRSIFLGVAATVALSLTVVSCQDGVDLGSPQSTPQQDIVEISAAMIASRTDDLESAGGDGSEVTYTPFDEGAQITVKGATLEPVIFTMNGERQWVSVEPFEWVETPGVVTAYYGAAAAIADGDEMPDIYFAEYDCNGQIPADGKLSFIDKVSFKHMAALVRVKFDRWGDTSSLTVKLANLHKYNYVTTYGEFDSGSDLMSVTLKQVSCESGYCFEGKIPAGDATNPNILSDYSLRIGSENIFNYIKDESSIPKFFTANTIYTFDITNTTVE